MFVPRQKKLLLHNSAPLQLQHHGAGSIDNLNVVLLCQQIGLWRFAVGAQQYLDIMQLFHVFVVDGDKPQVAEPVTFHSVVHDVAQAIERVALCQFFFGFLDGGGHAEAEAAAAVDFYL